MWCRISERTPGSRRKRREESALLSAKALIGGIGYLIEPYLGPLARGRANEQSGAPVDLLVAWMACKLHGALIEGREKQQR